MILKRFDVKAAVIFIAAHFATMSIYTLLVNNALWQPGFILHMLQASVYLFIPLININFKLKLASFVTSILYFLIAINWLLLERGIELAAQVYFYNYFASIITTINIIVIYLLGKNSAIHFFNMFSTSNNFFNKLRLHFRNVNNNNIFNLNLSFNNTNFKIKESSK